MILYQLAKWAEQNQIQADSIHIEGRQPSIDLKALEESGWYDLQNLNDSKLWKNGTLEHVILPTDTTQGELS